MKIKVLNEDRSEKFFDLGGGNNSTWWGIGVERLLKQINHLINQGYDSFTVEPHTPCSGRNFRCHSCGRDKEVRTPAHEL